MAFNLNFLDDITSNLNDDDLKTYFFDTGNYILNFMTSGSIFKGLPSKITTFASPPHVGKSLIVYTAFKTHLEADPENYVILYDIESAVDEESMKRFLGDSYSRFRLVGAKQQVNIAENFSNHIINLMDKLKDNYDGGKSKVMIAIDSMSVFSSLKGLDNMKTTGDVTAQWLVSQSIVTETLKVLVSSFKEMGIPVIMTAHMKPKVMGMAREMNIVGAKALEFLCSNFYKMSKVKSDNEIEETIARCRPHKSRYCRSMFVFDLPINYEKGIERYAGLFELLKADGVLKKRKNGDDIKYTGNEILDNIVFYQSDLDSNPDILEDKLDSINKYLQDTYRLGSTVELKIKLDDINIDAMEVDDMIDIINENKIDIDYMDKNGEVISKRKLKKLLMSVL